MFHLSGQWTSVPRVCTVSLSTLGTAALVLSPKANCWRPIPTHTHTPWEHWAALTSSWAQGAALMAPTHWMIAHLAPAKAAQSITTPPVDPLAVIPITLPWERTHHPKLGRGKDKGTGKHVRDARNEPYFTQILYTIIK